MLFSGLVASGAEDKPALEADIHSDAADLQYKKLKEKISEYEMLSKKISCKKKEERYEIRKKLRDIKKSFDLEINDLRVFNNIKRVRESQEPLCFCFLTRRQIVAIVRTINSLSNQNLSLILPILEAVARDNPKACCGDELDLAIVDFAGVYKICNFLNGVEVKQKQGEKRKFR